MKGIDPAKLTIIRYPDPRLSQICDEVTEFNDNLKAVAERMLELMFDGAGVGLAAPQVAVMKRIFVCNPTGKPADDAVYINPVLESLDGAADGEEGCLCLPGVIVPVRRSQRCVIRAKDLDGQEVILAGEDLIARIWQHETDHLNGVTIADRMSPASKITNRRAMKKLEDDYQAGRK